MKTPITYYGGKQKLAKTIVRLIPPHKIYAEPFIGGGAVYFAKPPSEVEIINDTNGEIVNFYEVAKHDFPALKKEVEATLHSRKAHRHARVIFENPDMFDRVKRAWAVFVLANMSFGSDMNAGYGHNLSGGMTGAFSSKIENFTEAFSKRLRNTQIECSDALKIIEARDTPETFYYLDPPYPDTDQGHYNGYTSDDFTALLELLANIQGKFLLSSFRHDVLEEYKNKNAWSQFEIKMTKPMTSKSKRSVQKIEVFTANYRIDKEGYGLLSLFDFSTTRGG
jgi:DNA adenine methylase